MSTGVTFNLVCICFFSIDRLSFSESIEKKQENNVLDSVSIYRSADSKDANHSLEREFGKFYEYYLKLSTSY